MAQCWQVCLCNFKHGYSNSHNSNWERKYHWSTQPTDWFFWDQVSIPIPISCSWETWGCAKSNLIALQSPQVFWKMSLEGLGKGELIYEKESVRRTATTKPAFTDLKDKLWTHDSHTMISAREDHLPHNASRFIQVLYSPLWSCAACLRQRGVRVSIMKLHPCFFILLLMMDRLGKQEAALEVWMKTAPKYAMPPKHYCHIQNVMFASKVMCSLKL